MTRRTQIKRCRALHRPYFRLAVHNWEHSTKEEKVARVRRFDVSAKRRRGGWELNAKVLQPAICTAQVQTSNAYHRPACAPPSTCSTSPVTWRASVR
jgi:hypothetical protein